MKAFGKAANAICCFLFSGANIQVSRRYFHLFHLPGSRNPCSISSCKSIEPAEAVCPQNKEGQQHPSIRQSIASRLKGDPAHLPNPGETHLGYWAQGCTPQCKRDVDRVSPVKGHKCERKEIQRGKVTLESKYPLEGEVNHMEPVQVLCGCFQQEDKSHWVQTET